MANSTFNRTYQDASSSYLDTTDDTNYSSMGSPNIYGFYGSGIMGEGSGTHGTRDYMAVQYDDSVFAPEGTTNITFLARPKSKRTEAQNATFTQTPPAVLNNTFDRTRSPVNATYNRTPSPGPGNATFDQSLANATFDQPQANTTYNRTTSPGPGNATFDQSRANATFDQPQGNSTYNRTPSPGPGNATFDQLRGNATFGSSGTRANATFGPSGTLANATFGPSGTRANTTFGPPGTRANATFDQLRANATFGPPGPRANVTFDQPRANATFDQTRSNATFDQTRSNATFGQPRTPANTTFGAPGPFNISQDRPLSPAQSSGIFNVTPPVGPIEATFDGNIPPEFFNRSLSPSPRNIALNQTQPGAFSFTTSSPLRKTFDSRRTASPFERTTDDPLARTFYGHPGTTLGRFVDGGFGSPSVRQDTTFPSFSRSMEQDSTGDLDSSSANASWVEVKEMANELLKSELIKTEEDLSPERQLYFFRNWFEDNFVEVTLFAYFSSTVKHILAEHMQEISPHREYTPGSLLLKLKKLCARFQSNQQQRDSVLIEQNRKISDLLSDNAQKMEDASNSVKELISGLMTRLELVNDRAVGATEEAAGLKVQLNDALIRVRRLEGKDEDSFARSLIEQREYIRKQRASFEANDETGSDIPYFNYQLRLLNMEEEVAVANAQKFVLQAELADEQALKERLTKELKDARMQIAVLQAELATSKDESIHKSRVLNVISGEIVNSFEKSLAQSLASSGEREGDAVETLEAWRQQLQDVIDAKKQEIASLDKLLMEHDLELADMKIRLEEKKNKMNDLIEQTDAMTEDMAKKTCEIEENEKEVGDLYEQLCDIQQAINLMRKEYVKKEQFFANLKNCVEAKDKEIAAVQSFRGYLAPIVKEDNNTSAVIPPRRLRFQDVSESTDMSSPLEVLSNLIGGTFQIAESPKLNYPAASSPYNSQLKSMQMKPMSGSPKEPMAMNLTFEPNWSSEKIFFNVNVNKDSRFIPIRETPVRFLRRKRKTYQGDYWGVQSPQIRQIQLFPPGNISGNISKNISGGNTYSTLDTSSSLFSPSPKQIAASYVKEQQNKTNKTFESVYTD